MVLLKSSLDLADQDDGVLISVKNIILLHRYIEYVDDHIFLISSGRVLQTQSQIFRSLLGKTESVDYQQLMS